MKRLFIILLGLLLVMLTVGCIASRPVGPPIIPSLPIVPSINSSGSEITPSVIPTSTPTVTAAVPIATTPATTSLVGTTADGIRREFDPGVVRGTTYILPSEVWVGGYHWITPTGNLIQSLKRLTSIVSPVDGKTYAMSLSDWTYDGYYHPLGADASKYFVVHNGGSTKSDFDVLLGNPGIGPMPGFNPLPAYFLHWVTVSANTVVIEPMSDSVITVVFNIPVDLADSQAMFLWIQKAGVDRLGSLLKSGVVSSELDLLFYFNSRISVPNNVALNDNASSDIPQLVQDFISKGYLVQSNAKKGNLEFQIKAKEQNQGNVVIEHICRWGIVMSPLE